MYSEVEATGDNENLMINCGDLEIRWRALIVYWDNGHHEIETVSMEEGFVEKKPHELFTA